MGRIRGEGEAELGPCHGGGGNSFVRVEVPSMANGNDGMNEVDEGCVSFSASIALFKLSFSFDEEFDGWSKLPTVSL